MRHIWKWSVNLKPWQCLQSSSWHSFSDLEKETGKYLVQKHWKLTETKCTLGIILAIIHFTYDFYYICVFVLHIRVILFLWSLFQGTLEKLHFSNTWNHKIPAYLKTKSTCLTLRKAEKNTALGKRPISNKVRVLEISVMVISPYKSGCGTRNVPCYFKNLYLETQLSRENRLLYKL